MTPLIETGGKPTENKFACDNGNYIDNHDFCNGIDNCG